MFRNIWQPMLGFGTFIILWEADHYFFASPLLPGLNTVWHAFQDEWLFNRITSDVIPSLRRLAAGYSIGLITGITLGIMLGVSPLLLRFLSPTLDFIRAIPPLALIPLYLVLFGIGDQPKIIIIMWGAFYAVLIASIDGIKSTESQLLDFSRAYRLSFLQSLYVRLYSAFPQILAGSRIALSLSFILMVTSEMFASTEGIGFFIIESQRSFAIAEMWSGIFLLGLVGIVLSVVFSFIELQLTKWHQGYQAAKTDF